MKTFRKSNYILIFVTSCIVVFVGLPLAYSLKTEFDELTILSVIFGFSVPIILFVYFYMPVLFYEKVMKLNNQDILHLISHSSIYKLLILWELAEQGKLSIPKELIEKQAKNKMDLPTTSEGNGGLYIYNSQKIYRTGVRVRISQKFFFVGNGYTGVASYIVYYKNIIKIQKVTKTNTKGEQIKLCKIKFKHGIITDTILIESRHPEELYDFLVLLINEEKRRLGF